MLLIKVSLTAGLQSQRITKLHQNLTPRFAVKVNALVEVTRLTYMTHSSVDTGFLVCFLVSYSYMTWNSEKNVFKLLKIKLLQKTFLVHGRIFTKWELAGSLYLKGRHSFFPLDPMLSAIFFHKRTCLFVFF